jgi:hypothetical protein
MENNYTPLNLNHQSTNRTRVIPFLVKNLLAFLIALFVLANYLVLKNINKKQAYQSKASEKKVVGCPTDLDINPKKVTAYIVDEQGKKTEIEPKATVSADAKIIFIWEKIPLATDYFIALGTISPSIAEGRVDPALKGFNTQLNSYTFDSLSPNKTYYLFIRSNSIKGLGITFPDPKKCFDYLPALPIFEFSTK